MRWLKWCGKIVITVMLVSTLTLLTTGLIVQSYVESLLSSFNIAWEGQPTGLTSIFQGALGMNSSNTSESTEEQKKTLDDTAKKQSSNSPESLSGGKDSAPDLAESPDEGTENPEETKDPVVMSQDAMAEYKDTIPNEEKTEVFDLLMNKIPTDEMQLIASNMENGITEQELQDMEQVIAKYLTEDEYKQLMAILTPEQ
ncbi:hypothetical protein J45TS6_09710 [Paenibacillus sp. J45TS6]|uniref:hypothetical protein n=1 Tax=unclassified Paenibacillus TaxID=185978 RepID=UPI001B2B4B63|nr:hypothetical protein [Paenibacillus sp. J45TS6]GIP42512.1 hypothetical protein J45TS6_09710 [Paenibacillus sp. J45TS6]